MAELGDPRSFKRALADRIEEVSRDRVIEATEYAEAEANRRLLNGTPPEGASMNEWHMDPIADSSRTYWDDSREIAVAEWQHPHADKIEVGTQPHLIEGDPVLVFEDWETGETVFATEVQHPGIPAVGFIRGGFADALNEFFD